MCPNGKNSSSLICPGAEGTLHPKTTQCDFVCTFFDDKGCGIVVARGLGRNQYMAMRPSLSGSHHRVKSPSLPVRETFDEAQTDLNNYAAIKKWRRFKV
jgi:hypothetical protein